jgi:hypothetical protein
MHDDSPHGEHFAGIGELDATHNGRAILLSCNLLDLTLIEGVGLGLLLTMGLFGLVLLYLYIGKG